MCSIEVMLSFELKLETNPWLHFSELFLFPRQKFVKSYSMRIGVAGKDMSNVNTTM